MNFKIKTKGNIMTPMGDETGPTGNGRPGRGMGPCGGGQRRGWGGGQGQGRGPRAGQNQSGGQGRGWRQGRGFGIGKQSGQNANVADSASQQKTS